MEKHFNVEQSLQMDRNIFEMSTVVRICIANTLFIDSKSPT